MRTQKLQIFTRKFTLALIPFTLIFSLSSCFVTIAAPGFFVDISSEEDNEKVTRVEKNFLELIEG